MLNGVPGPNGLVKKEEETKKTSDVASEVEHHNKIVAQYQQIIREQDTKLREQIQLNQMLSQTCSQLQEYYNSVCNQYNSLRETFVAREAEYERRLKEQNAAQKHSESPIAEKLNVQAKINELEVKVHLLEEKFV